MSEALLELEELFGVEQEEETPVEPKKTATKKRNEQKEEASTSSTKSEEAVGERKPVEEIKQTDRNPKESREKAGSVGSNPVEIPENKWSSNIIGKPKGRPNPYFQGVVASDGLNGKQIFIPFKDIQFLHRQFFVDDITLENPTILAEIYRVQGTFNDVIARITKEMFEEIEKHPEVKLKNVNYSWVSDHKSPRRNYIVNHANRPTLEEFKKLDKHIDEVEWALMPWHEKEALKKQDKKYEEMPKDEEIPLPVEDELLPIAQDEESEMTQLEE